MSCSKGTEQQFNKLETLRLDSIRARKLITLGHKFRINDQKIQALNNYNEAIEILENSNQLDFISLNARAAVYFEVENLLKAREDIKRAIRYAKTDAERIQGYANISVTFSNKETDSTIRYLKKAITYCAQRTDSYPCFIAYNNLASTYMGQSKNDQALKVFSENIDIHKLDTSAPQRIYQGALITLGEIYYNLKKYDTSAATLNTSLDSLSKSNNDLSFIIEAKELLSKNYEKKGDLKLCISILKEVDTLKAKLNDITIKKEIAEIENNKLIEVQESEIDDLGELISKTKIISFIVIFFLLLTVVIFLYRGYKNKLRLHKLNESLSLNRLKSLRSIMNPHFLFNSFNTLQNFILKKEHLKANEYMTDLSTLIREVLSSSDSIFHSFKKEVQILQTYIDLEQCRFQNKFIIEVEVDNSLLELNPKIPSMMIQPYVENSILHGFPRNYKKGKLQISFKKQDNQLICIVRDNGIGREQAQENKSSSNKTNHLSIATRNTDERLHILNTIIASNSQIEIKDLFSEKGIAAGTEVQITLPIKEI